ncbi:MAG: hypothetical protein F6K39_36980 [Okeania sp. SIO3B3]|nr:hypothetical protein [Okeania sp. SIO3B3]
MNSYTLEEGRQRAEGSYAEGKERFKGRRFFITNYPDMILREASLFPFVMLPSKTTAFYPLKRGGFING